MFLIGLTGSIASGKSTVSSIFSNKLGVAVVDADLIARIGKKFLKKRQQQFSTFLVSKSG